MFQNTRSLCAVVALSALAGCGDSGGSRQTVRPSGRDINDRDVQVDAWVRARTEVTMRSGATLAFHALTPQSGASHSSDMKSEVAEAVRFDVSDSAFVSPTNPEMGTLSFGKLSITRLRDNNLKVCGLNGKELCTSAELRVYTSGAPGDGLWNSDRSYGLPITTSENPVRLGAAAAHTLAKVTIGNTKVINLSDFGGGNPMDIDFSVNYDNAAAGSYETTLILEYLLR